MRYDLKLEHAEFQCNRDIFSPGTKIITFYKIFKPKM